MTARRQKDPVRDPLGHLVQLRTGLRDSPRLEAAIEIMRLFDAGTRMVHRTLILERLSSRFYWKCLDRAVDALVRSGCLVEADGVRLRKGGGRHYRSDLCGDDPSVDDLDAFDQRFWGDSGDGGRLNGEATGGETHDGFDGGWGF